MFPGGSPESASAHQWGYLTGYLIAGHHAGLVHDLNASAILCTATQPALEQRQDFKIGIPSGEIFPIIRDEANLFQILERVESHNLGSLDDGDLIAHILTQSPLGCLLILNTTKAAQTLHEKLSPHTHTLHLSARMCPRHVMLVLARAKRLRKQGKAVVLISTQLIEAGVDISFPTVYRAECGLDSFAQAAGRCNRNGELKDNDGKPVKGRVYHFQPTDHPFHPHSLGGQRQKTHRGNPRPQKAEPRPESQPLPPRPAIHCPDLRARMASHPKHLPPLRRSLRHPRAPPEQLPP